MELTIVPSNFEVLSFLKPFKTCPLEGKNHSGGWFELLSHRMIRHSNLFLIRRSLPPISGMADEMGIEEE
jgi:hypothetical protein